MRITAFGLVALCSLVKASNFPSFTTNDETNLRGANRTQAAPSKLNHDRWSVPGIGTLFRPAIATTKVSSGNNSIMETIRLPAIKTDDAVVSSRPLSLPLESEARAAVNASLEPIRINIGGPTVVDAQGRTWIEDSFFIGGNVYTDGRFNVLGTNDSALFHSERNGIFQYEVPLPVNGSYQVTLHFAELYASSAGERVFDIHVEGRPFFTNVDIFQLAGGKAWTAALLVWSQVISDGVLSLAFLEGTPPRNVPSLAGMEIALVESHLAHASTGGPYVAVDFTNRGSVAVPVDGSLSHTHAPNENLVQYIWKKGSSVLGNGVQASLQLSVGKHTVTLTIVDSAGNEATDTTQVVVRSSKYPYIGGISPSKGSVVGNTRVTITGSGFTYSANETVVQFGKTKVASSMVKIVNANTIQVMSPANAIGAPVAMTVKTPIGVSNSLTFTYVASHPIEFASAPLIPMVKQPSVVAFGPDRRLYIGTTVGTIMRVSFQDGSFKITGSIEVVVAQNRAILGLAFDPMDLSSSPRVYFSHSFFFHGSPTSTSGQSINGKVSVARGNNLDIVEDIITGLPVSDHDHGVNGIEFGDKGELYIQIGGNTNGGIPGPMSGSHLQKESVLSAATLVANLAHPNFDGNLRYDALDDGNLVGGFGVEVFAAGNRNPYGITLHSNGFLYGTDNGMNNGYGDIQLDCMGRKAPARYESDKINLLIQGQYYGHPNSKRGASDPRQCVWHSPRERGINGYSAPIAIAPSSTDGVIEFKSNHFGGQLRGNLILSQHQGGLYRVILSSDGQSVIPESNPPIPLLDGYGLSVAQAPSGELVEAQIGSNQVWYHRPVERSTSFLVLKSVFPHRGGSAGGSSLHIYGTNLIQNSTKPTITVGGKSCPVTTAKVFRVQCTLPAGIIGTTVDIVAKLGNQSSTFKRGYRYIQGRP